MVMGQGLTGACQRGLGGCCRHFMEPTLFLTAHLRQRSMAMPVACLKHNVCVHTDILRSSRQKRQDAVSAQIYKKLHKLHARKWSLVPPGAETMRRKKQTNLQHSRLQAVCVVWKLRANAVNWGKRMLWCSKQNKPKHTTQLM